MALWKDQTPAKKEPLPHPADEPHKDADPRAQSYDLPRRPADRDTKESVIASGLTIQGKIEGSGHVRIAGRFHGDVHVQGDLTIESGAKVIGGVRASTVTIGGELEGNIEAATRVDLLATGVLNGNLTAGALTVAAGSRMRGQVEFGWEEKAPKRAEGVRESISAA